MTTWMPLLLFAAAAGHEANPLFQELRETGVAVGEAKVPLPEPLMADGLDAAGQEKVIRGVIGGEFRFADFVRNSPVAPISLDVRSIAAPNAAHPVKGLDVAFVAFGKLDTIAAKGFFGNGKGDAGGEGKALTPADLAKRGITIAEADAKNEGYATIVYGLIDKVELKAVARGYWTRSAESVVAAGRFDPRFNADAEFPNQWRSMTKKPGGKVDFGEPQPYDAAGYYIKVTQLAEPAGAMFVEMHIVFAEPKGWFNGANLLLSKLPPVIQSLARTFRRDLTKAK